MFLLLCPALAIAQQAGPYGTEQTVYLNFLAADGTDLTGEQDGGSEVTLSCDGAAGTTSTNDFGADTNTAGWYSLTLTAAETQCKTLNIQVAASVAQSYSLETYGHADAKHPEIGFATDSITADALAADAVDEIWNEVIEDTGATYTGRCILAALLSYAAGELSTTSSVSTYQDPGGNATRIQGTVTTSGNRGSLTVTCP